MKKGISLIVLVITIIVLAILAGAVIISLSNTNVVDQASNAVSAADLANAKNVLTLAYSEAVAFGFANGKTDGKAWFDYEGSIIKADDAYYKTKLEAAGYKNVSVAEGTGVKWVVTATDGEVPSVRTN